MYSHAEPQSSDGSIVNLRTGRWFDPRLGQYSFQGLMIVIATGFIPLPLLSVVLTMVMWEAASGLKRILCSTLFRHWLCGKAASGLERIFCRVLVKRTPGKHG